MQLHDLDQYLRLVAPADTSQFQLENLTVMRLTLGQPMSVVQYEAIRRALADHEAECNGAEPEPVTMVECINPVTSVEPVGVEGVDPMRFELTDPVTHVTMVFEPKECVAKHDPIEWYGRPRPRRKTR